MASTYLSRTPSSAGNRKTWTFSAWIKRSKLSIVGSTILFASNTSAGSNDEDCIAFEASDKLRFSLNNGADANVKPNRVFRDTNAWYHIVLAVDTTQATASDRVKWYFNGVQETSFDTETYPSQNYDCKINNTTPQGIGFIDDIAGGGNSTYFDGSMSHIHFIDGTQYQASDFGEYDANGVWTIKTSPSVTYGTNGFFILKDGNSVTDQSGNSNNFTVGGGTLTNTEDSPSNVFATLNPLVKNTVTNFGFTLSQGNLKVTPTTLYYDVPGNLATSVGKWYWEAKMITSIANENTPAMGVIDIDKANFTQLTYLNNPGTCYTYGATGIKTSDINGTTSNSAYGDTFSQNDIIGCALDLDNGFIYFSKNGTWQNSGDPESGATGTGSAFSSVSGNFTSLVRDYSGANTPEWQYNFGNGYFGTTAVASAGTNASGIGIFEYDVPTGYTALSTKGLNL
jgi:hypothetical protein